MGSVLPKVKHYWMPLVALVLFFATVPGVAGVAWRSLPDGLRTLPMVIYS